MFIKYLNKIRAEGKRYFDFAQIVSDLGISDDSAKSGLYCS